MVVSEKRSTDIDRALQQKIEQRAYEIWENEGGPHGCNVDHWLRAEAEIMSSQSATMTPSVRKPSTHAKPKGRK